MQADGEGRGNLPDDPRGGAQADVRDAAVAKARADVQDAARMEARGQAGKQEPAVAGRKKSDLSRAFSEDGERKTHVGGQALLEGIMMRGKYNWAVAVREPDGGIYVEEHDLASGKKPHSWLHWPLVRGCRALVESLVLSYKALEIAALHAFDDEEGEDNAGGREGADARAAGEKTEGERASTGTGGTGKAVEAGGSGDSEPTLSEKESTFSWKDDFGRPDTMIDALGAQTKLEVVSEEPSLMGEVGEGFSSEEPNLVGKVSEGLPDVPDCGESTPKRTKVREAGLGPQDGASGSPAASATPACSSEQAEQEEFGKKEMAVSMVLGLVLGVALFIVAPAFVTNLIVGEYDQHTLVWNIVDGLLRVAVFVGYLWLIGRMSDIKRMFGYHGAEHKTIHCYEHGLPLTPENARSFPRLHVRCGTAFLIMVMIIAIFVYTVVPLNALIGAWGVPDGAPKLVLVVLTRIVLMPVIAGIAYEITVRWAGSHPENPLVKVILWPGMQMQYLTTNEPDDGMLECAIAAMQRVLEREEAEAAKAAAPTAAPEEPAAAI